MIGDILTTLVYPAATAFVAGFTSWFFARKRYAAETKTVDLDNLKKQFDILMEMSLKSAQRADDLENKLRTTNTFVTDVLQLLCDDLKCTKRSNVKVVYDNLGPHLRKEE